MKNYVTQFRKLPVMYKALVLFLLIGLVLPASFAFARGDAAPVPQETACPDSIGYEEATLSASGAGDVATSGIGTISIAGDGSSASWSVTSAYTTGAVCIEVTDGDGQAVYWSEFYDTIITSGSLSNPDEGESITRAVLYANELESVNPILNCVADNGDGTYTAYWGFYNENSHVSVTIPVGPSNYFSPGDQNRGQPIFFPPGDNQPVSFVFSTPFPTGTTLTWTIVGPSGSTNSATASVDSPLCQETPTPTEPTPTEPTPTDPTPTEPTPTDPTPTDPTPTEPTPTDPTPTDPTPTEPTATEPPPTSPPATDPPGQPEQPAGTPEVELPLLGGQPVEAVAPAAGGLGVSPLLLGGLGGILLGALRLAWSIVKRR